MVRDRGRRDPAHGDQFPAGQVPAARDRLEDTEARFVGQRFGDFLDLRAVHWSDIQGMAGV